MDRIRYFYRNSPFSRWSFEQKTLTVTFILSSAGIYAWVNKYQQLYHRHSYLYDTLQTLLSHPVIQTDIGTMNIQCHPLQVTAIGKKELSKVSLRLHGEKGEGVLHISAVGRDIYPLREIKGGNDEEELPWYKSIYSTVTTSPYKIKHYVLSSLGVSSRSLDIVEWSDKGEREKRVEIGEGRETEIFPSYSLSYSQNPLTRLLEITGWLLPLPIVSSPPPSPPLDYTPSSSSDVTTPLLGVSSSLSSPPSSPPLPSSPPSSPELFESLRVPENREWRVDSVFFEKDGTQYILQGTTNASPFVEKTWKRDRFIYKNKSLAEKFTLAMVIATSLSVGWTFFFRVQKSIGRYSLLKYATEFSKQHPQIRSYLGEEGLVKGVGVKGGKKEVRGEREMREKVEREMRGKAGRVDVVSLGNSDSNGLRIDTVQLRNEMGNSGQLKLWTTKGKVVVAMLERPNKKTVDIDPLFQPHISSWWYRIWNRK